ncbi:TonB-dependent receptor [Pseudomonas sp. 21LCFQ010]|uniref:TonB-dependent siderophore receptor n=1 Tax=Pseudomonas sp. 21LCFQ010 TaxID=2957506 RepID=UPI002097C526|nr:TonB-dependent receptor [Pseudomonas sp. 21LCFQ010]MCO8162374.1 TonB-dependent receptor [Pseudomonas sp. 21LCFQ010]
MPYLPATPRSRLSLSIRHTLVASLLAGVPALPAWAASTMPAQQQQSRTYAIAAGSLDQVLNRFASESGTLLSVDGTLTAGKRSPGLNGSYGVREGLAKLLADTGLQAINSAGNYTLQKVIEAGDAVVLGATDINARGLGATTENTGSYTTGSMQTATKLALTMRETPQSVSVVTRQQMDDASLTTVQEAISKTPGLTMQKIGPERYTFYARGFQINSLLYDGLPTLLGTAADAVTPANLAMYDRVEVTRGATGLVQGSGSPSAAINLVRKRPTAEPQAELTLGAGSWDNYRSEMDLSGPLNESRSIRGRTVVTYQDRNSFQDTVSKEHSLLYAVGEVDLNPDTTLTLGASYQNENNNVAWNGLTTAANGRDLKLSRSRNFAADWEYWDMETRMLFVDLEHRMSNDWTLRMAANQSWSELDYLGSYPGRLTSNVSTLSIRGSGGHVDDRQSSYDLYLSGPFELLDRRHELVLGASRRKDVIGYRSSGVYNFATNIDPYLFNSAVIAKPSLNTREISNPTQTDQDSLYSTARFTITDDLKVILGARLDWYDYDYLYDFKGSVSTSQAKETRHLTRYAGALYDLDEHHTAYVSYTDIFQPQTYIDSANKLLTPVEGENYEIGIKGEYFAGVLNTSIALFQIIQRNRPKSVDDQTSCTTYPQSTCYEAAGKVRNQGIDIQLSGALTPNWDMSAGYTFSQAKYHKDSGVFERGDLFDTDVPRHQFKLSTMYKLPNQWERWRVGGSLYSQSSIFNKGTTAGVGYEIEQAAYYIVDLNAGYKASEHLDLRFGLNNVFDKKYYQTISQNTSSWPTAFYGDPRNIQVTASYRF